MAMTFRHDLGYDTVTLKMIADIVYITTRRLNPRDHD